MLDADLVESVGSSAV
ncbi:hypothetical protein VCHC56A1_3351, partial [Vibrio cholerae HC-56A1]